MPLQQSESAPDADAVAMIELQLESVEQLVNEVMRNTTAAPGEAPTTSTTLASGDDTLSDFPSLPVSGIRG